MKIQGSHEHCRLPTTLPKLSCRRPSSRMVHLGEPSCADELKKRHRTHSMYTSLQSTVSTIIWYHCTPRTSLQKMPYSCSNPQILRIVSDLSWSADAPNASACKEWSKSNALKDWLISEGSMYDCTVVLLHYSQELYSKYCYILQHLVVSRHTDIPRHSMDHSTVWHHMSLYVTICHNMSQWHKYNKSWAKTCTVWGPWGPWERGFCLIFLVALTSHTCHAHVCHVRSAVKARFVGIVSPSDDSKDNNHTGLRYSWCFWSYAKYDCTCTVPTCCIVWRAPCRLSEYSMCMQI